jgi:hypothetical protein
MRYYMLRLTGRTCHLTDLNGFDEKPFGRSAKHRLQKTSQGLSGLTSLSEALT